MPRTAVSIAGLALCVSALGGCGNTQPAGAPTREVIVLHTAPRSPDMRVTDGITRDVAASEVATGSDR